MITINAIHRSGFEVRVKQDDPMKIDKTISWLLHHDYRSRHGYDLTPGGLPSAPATASP